MKREKLEQYLHKDVKITFLDGRSKKGTLYKEEDFPNDPNKLRDGGYLLRPCYDFPYYNHHFRKSHVKGVERL